MSLCEEFNIKHLKVTPKICSKLKVGFSFYYIHVWVYIIITQFFYQLCAVFKKNSINVLSIFLSKELITNI